MNKLLISCCLLLSASICEVLGQQHVIASAGSHSASDHAQISWTLGQVVSGSSYTNSNLITSGFHHGGEIVSVVASHSPLGLQVRIYPNPTSDLLSIQPPSGSYQGSYQLIAPQGHLVMDEREVNFAMERTIEMGHLPEGMYLLRISIDHQPIQQLKIIKQ